MTVAVEGRIGLVWNEMVEVTKGEIVVVGAEEVATRVVVLGVITASGVNVLVKVVVCVLVVVILPALWLVEVVMILVE